jgi:hypothetical protein
VSASCSIPPWGGEVEMDWFYVALTTAFFILAAGYVRACERL